MAVRCANSLEILLALRRWNGGSLYGEYACHQTALSW
jgi:hypothetical protein